MRIRRAQSAGLLLAAAAFVTACAQPSPATVDTPAMEVTAHGADRGNGNLLAVQAWLHPGDYTSEEALHERLGWLLDEAAARGWLGPRTVVVLPEHVGTWLVAEGEAPDTFTAATTSDAMGNVVLARPVEWMGALLGAPADDGFTYATFSAKGARMAEVYQRIMSSLASAHGVTLVAGSILLPEPRVDDGRIVTEAGGALRNVSFVFGGDGALLGPPVVKSFPTQDEQPFVTAGDARDLPVFDTPAGRLGVLVCADSWFPAAWRALDDKDADLVAVPVFVAGQGAWSEPWQGYSGHDEPDDVDLDDIGALSEAEAWRKYALPGRLPTTGARAGITAPLRGTLWDLESDGQALLATSDKVGDAPVYDGPALINLWL